MDDLPHTLMLGKLALQWWQAPTHLAMFFFGAWAWAAMTTRSSRK